MADVMTEQEKEEQKQEEEEEEANKKAEYGMQEKKMIDRITSLQHSTMTTPLGRDRMYRRYWMFQTMPGLFIEENDDFVSENALRPAPQNPNPEDVFAGKDIKIPKNINKPAVVEPKQAEPVQENGGSDKENDSMNTSLNTSVNTATVANVSENNTQEPKDSTAVVVNGVDNDPTTPVVNGEKKEDVVEISDDDEDEESEEEEEELPPLDLNCPVVKQIVERPRYQWSYIASEEQFEALIISLNMRGFREGSLRQTLVEHKSRILGLIDKCPTKSLSVPLKDEQDVEMRSESPAEPLNGHNLRLKRTKKGLMKGDCAQEVLEINLRELLLDFEERVFVGSLGTLKVRSDFEMYNHFVKTLKFDLV